MPEAEKSYGNALLLLLFISATFIVVASYWFVLMIGYGFVFFTPEGVSVGMEPFPAYFLLFFVVGFYIPVEASAVFSLLVILYVLCFTAAWKWRESFHSVLRKSFSLSFRSFFKNFLLVMPLISSMVLLAVMGIIYAQDLLGVQTGQPIWGAGTPKQQIFLELAYAPFAEELGFRLIPIGLFMILYVFMMGRTIGVGGLRLLVASVLYPEGAKRAAGLPNVSEHGILRGISKGEWIMIVSTSVLFGFAHLLSGIGWEVGKITSVSLQGFVFALTYIAYGFAAPILLHWFFNYYLFFFDPEIVSEFFPTADPVLLAIETVIIVLGIVGWAAFTAAGIRRLAKLSTAKQEVSQTTPPRQSP